MDTRFLWFQAVAGLISEDEAEALVELHRKDIDEEPDGKTALIGTAEIAELTGGHGIDDAPDENEKGHDGNEGRGETGGKDCP